MLSRALLLILGLAVLTGEHCYRADDDLGGMKIRLGELGDVGRTMGEDFAPLRRLLQNVEEVTDDELSDYIFDVLTKDGDLTAPGPEGLPPLMVAAHHGFTDLIKTLLELDVDVNSRDKDGHTALMFAAQSGQLKSSEFLISNGADVNLRSTKNGFTATFLASANGHAKVLEVLIEAGGDIESLSSKNISPLIIATVRGQAAVVRVLLENNADVSITTDEGDTAILRAVQFDPTIPEAKANHIEILRLLLRAGADPDTKKAKDDQSLLWIAVFNGDVEALTLLLDSDADVDSPASDGTAPVFIAVHHCEPCLNLLLSVGADPDPVYPANGWTPLHFASALGDLEACKVLVTSGADKTIEDNDGNIPYDIIGVLISKLGSRTRNAIQKILEPEDVPARDRDSDERVKGARVDPMYVLIIVGCAAVLGGIAVFKTCSKRCTEWSQSFEQSRAMISDSDGSESERDIEGGNRNGERIQEVHFVLNPVYHEGPYKSRYS